ncbi:MAG: glycosyltransferase family 4 protein [Caulobacteraceae bacterium]
MRLLTVTPYFDTHRGGVELVAGRLARELQGRGFEVTWIATDAVAPAADAMATVSVKALNILERRLGVPYPFPSPAALRRIGQEVARADAVLLHDSLYATNVAAFMAARRAGKPVVVVQHIGEVPYSNPILRLMMRAANALIARPILARADQVVFISEITRRFFSGIAFERPPLAIFNGVDTEVFRPAASADESRAVRAHLGLSSDRPVVLFVGRFVEKKGLNLIRLMAASRPDLQFALAGWGPIAPESWALPNVTVFDKLQGASLAELYRASDILVLPSTGEGFPLVVQEAMACGLPVVCGAETAEADPAAAPFLSGIPIDPAAPDATAAAFLDAMAKSLMSGHDDDARARRTAFATLNYAWSAAADRYAALLRGLVAR